MKEPTLFRIRKVCCYCRASQTRNHGRTVPGEPRVQSVIPYLSWRGQGKNQLRKGERVEICEKCLSGALQGGFSDSDEIADTLLMALLRSIRESYSYLVEADR